MNSRSIASQTIADTSLEIYEVSDRPLTILPKEISRTPDRHPTDFFDSFPDFPVEFQDGGSIVFVMELSPTNFLAQLTSLLMKANAVIV